MVLFVMVVVPFEAFKIPLNVDAADVDPSELPSSIEFAVVLLPIVFALIVKFALAPAVFIPLKVYPIAIPPPMLIPPIILF